MKKSRKHCSRAEHEVNVQSSECGHLQPGGSLQSNIMSILTWKGVTSPLINKVITISVKLRRPSVGLVSLFFNYHSVDRSGRLEVGNNIRATA